MTLRQLLPSLFILAGVLAVMGAGLWLSTRAIRRWARRLEEKNKEQVDAIERWANQLIRFSRHSIEAVAGLAALVILLRTLGLRGISRLTWEQVVYWLTGPGMRILFVLASAFILSRILHVLVSRLPLFVVPRDGSPTTLTEQRKRATTITQLLEVLTTVLVMGIAVLIVLRELGVDITPILTGAGIVGLALGFGAQHLVRDIIAGFFLILEDQLRVGDVAIINGKGGLVEAIGLRTVVLRDLDGRVHIFPNGTINELSNLTKDYSYYLIDLGVAYKENVDQVMSVLKEVGVELRRDPAYAEKILEPLEVLGVDAFADSAVILKLRIKTLPREQWLVGRELRRRIKNAFDARGIEIPYPHLSVYFGEASQPFAVEVAEQLASRERR